MIDHLRNSFKELSMPRDHEPLVEMNAELDMQAMLVLLLGVSDCARLRGRYLLDSALELGVLCQRDILEEVIQLAVARGYVVCPPALTRSPEQPGILLWQGPRVALTEKGAVLARQVACACHGGVEGNGRRFDRAKARPKPQWDGRTGQLRYEGTLILQLRRSSSFQWQLLTAFQELHWAWRIDDPIPRTKGNGSERLRQTAHDLNRKQKPPRLRFLVEANGRGVRWEAVR